MSRSRWLIRWLGGPLLAVLLVWMLARTSVAPWPWPVRCTGQTPPGLGRMIDTARALRLPGFQLAWEDGQGRQGSCAAGWAGPWVWQGPLRTGHVMRYASLSKILTASVAMQLFAEGKLQPADRAVAVLGLPGPWADPRVAGITVGQLLRHTAGFDRALSGDPMMAPRPPGFDLLPYLRSVRLDHDPGTHYAYANVGYHWLGALIEHVEGAPLEAVFRRRLLAPAGVDTVVALRAGQRLAGEPRHRFDAREPAATLLAFDYGAMLASGAWAGTAADFLALLRTVFGGAGHPGLLTEAQQQAMFAVDAGCPTGQWRTCHGFGFYRHQAPGQTMMHWRDGSLPGVSSFAALLPDGAKLVWLAHGRRLDWVRDNDRVGQALYALMQDKWPADRP